MRDTRAAELQWREHGFGPWAIRDRRDESFLGGAELRFAGHGIGGIAPDEIEAGWWVTEGRRKEGIASEAMHAAIDDLWGRTDIESITAYIEEGANEPSRRLAAKLGFAVRGSGRGRSGEPMTVYELRRTTGFDEDSEASKARVAWASVRECHLISCAEATIRASCRGVRQEVLWLGRATPETVSKRRVPPRLMQCHAS